MFNLRFSKSILHLNTSLRTFGCSNISFSMKCLKSHFSALRLATSIFSADFDTSFHSDFIV